MAGSRSKITKPDEDVKGVSSAAVEGDSVTLALAHPISRPEDKRYLGLPEDGEYGPGDQVTVNKNGAQSLISAGMVQVDVGDPEAVRRALGEDVDDDEDGAEQVAATATGTNTASAGSPSGAKPSGSGSGS